MNEEVRELAKELSQPGRASIAAEALVQFGEEALNPLLEIVRDRAGSGLARVYASIALGELEDTRALQDLTEVLADVGDHWEVRRRAAWALGQIGEPSSAAALEYALENDHNPDVRGFAAQALGALGAPSALPVLVAHLTDMEEMDNWSPVASAAVAAIGVIDGDEAESALLSIIRSWIPSIPDEPIGAIIGTLMGTGPSSSEDTMCIGAALSLGERGSPRAIPEMRRLHDGAQNPLLKLALEEALEKLLGRSQLQ